MLKNIRRSLEIQVSLGVLYFLWPPRGRGARRFGALSCGQLGALSGRGAPWGAAWGLCKQGRAGVTMTSTVTVQGEEERGKDPSLVSLPTCTEAQMALGCMDY